MNKISYNHFSGSLLDAISIEDKTLTEHIRSVNSEEIEDVMEKLRSLLVGKSVNVIDVTKAASNIPEIMINKSLYIAVMFIIAEMLAKASIDTKITIMKLMRPVAIDKKPLSSLAEEYHSTLPDDTNDIEKQGLVAMFVGFLTIVLREITSFTKFMSQTNANYN